MLKNHKNTGNLFQIPLQNLLTKWNQYWRHCRRAVMRVRLTNILLKKLLFSIVVSWLIIVSLRHDRSIAKLYRTMQGEIETSSILSKLPNMTKFLIVELSLLFDNEIYCHAKKYCEFNRWSISTIQNLLSPFQAISTSGTLQKSFQCMTDTPHLMKQTGIRNN